MPLIVGIGVSVHDPVSSTTTKNSKITPKKKWNGSFAVYNANGGTTVPGTPMSIPSTDPDAQAAYDNVAAPYNYLKNRFN
jgi:hypothetical protein